VIPTLPPLPPFIPFINLPKVIPVNPKPKVDALDDAIRPPTTVEPEVVTYPPKVRPAKPDVCSPERIKALEAKLAALDEEDSPNKYLPPKHDLDSEWEAWKVRKIYCETFYKSQMYIHKILLRKCIKFLSTCFAFVDMA
jgi:hypothetical protein